MLKDYFIEITKDALIKAYGLEEKDIDLKVDVPKNKDFGDFAINISALSRILKKSPLEI